MKKTSFKKSVLDVLINPVVSVLLSVTLTFGFLGALTLLGSMSYFHKPVFLFLQQSLGIRADYFIVPYVWISMMTVYLVGYFALVEFAGSIDIRNFRKKDEEISIDKQWSMFLWGAWYDEKGFFWYHLKYYTWLLLCYSVIVLVFHRLNWANMFQPVNNNIRWPLSFVIISGIYMILSGVILKFYLEKKV